MKIAILTFHRAYNCGAMLQAWALKSALNSLGHEALFIDFGARDERNRWHVKVVKLGFGFNVLKRFVKSILHDVLSIGVVERYRCAYLHFCRRYLPERPLRGFDFAKECDLVLVGSDQVWNLSLIGGFSRLLLGELIPDSVPLIGYSISIGDNRPTLCEQGRIISAIRRFSAVSLRENLLAVTLGHKSPKVLQDTLDPLLLTTKDQLEGLASKDLRPKGDYVYFYTVNVNVETINYAHRFADAVGLPLITSPNYVDSRFEAPRGLTYGVGPAEMLAYAKHAKYVLACSFHGTVVAFLLGRPFVSVCLSSDIEDSRQFKILKLLGLQDKLVTINTDVRIAVVKSTLPVSLNAIRVLDEEKKKSFEYLKSSIASCEKENRQGNELIET